MARPTDRLETVVRTLLLAAALVMVAVGIRAGNAVAHGEVGRGPRTHEGAHATTATATEDSRPLAGPLSDGYPPVWTTPIRWSSPTGEVRHGTVVLDDGVAAGESVQVVVNAEGRARALRAAPGDVAVKLVVGIDTVLLGWLMLGLLWHVVGAVLARRRVDAWGAEWERVEPEWSGRSS